MTPRHHRMNPHPRFDSAQNPVQHNHNTMPRIKAGDTWQRDTTTLMAVSDGYMKAVGQQGQRQQHVMVVCSCGTSSAFDCAAHRLRSSVQPTKSCGCLQKQAIRAACFKPVTAGDQWHGKYTTLTATADSYMKPGKDGTPTHCVMVQCSCPIKQHLFCKSRFSEAGHLASMFR
jgi:hypothetical protein